MPDSAAAGPGKRPNNYGRKRDLYLAKSLRELNDKSDVTEACKKQKPEQLVNTAQRLLKAANEEKPSDEEKAYLLFMRYANTRKFITKTPQYKADKKYYDGMLSVKDLLKALEATEELSASLESRYALKAAPASVANPTNGARKAATLNHEQPAEGDSVAKLTHGLARTKLGGHGGLANGTAADAALGRPVFPEIIEPTKLHSLMKEKSTTFLLLDARKSGDFKTCQLRHTNVINVPEELLEPGATASQIGSKLKIEDKSQWQRRSTVDLLIMLDWCSEQANQSPALRTLRDAMFRWDPETRYKSGVHILKGGIHNFTLHYPIDVSSPERGRNPPSEYVKRNSSVGVKNALLHLDQLEYPDLGAAFIATPSPQSSPNTSAAAAAQHQMPPSTAATAAAASSKVKPTENGGLMNSHSSSMSSMTSSLYPSTSDLSSDLNRAFNSGAITVTREASPRRTLPSAATATSTPRPPLVPDRNTKPMSSADTVRNILNRDKAAGAFIATNGIVSDQEEEEEKENERPYYDSKAYSNPVPKIDRSSKAKALLRINNQVNSVNNLTSLNNDNNNKEMREVLDAETDLIDDSLELEKHQLELERRWEEIRLRREKQAGEEMKMELLKKEEQLLEEIRNHEVDKKKRDAECAQLRTELEQLKARLERESRVRQQVVDADERAKVIIKAKEEERRKLEQEVEQKRRERKRQQQERKELEEGRLKLHQSEEKRMQIERELAAKQQRQRQLQEQATITKTMLKDDSSFGGGGLNRSHSSPNIAKMVEDEQIPRIPNRDNKPRTPISFRNNLDPVGGGGGRTGGSVAAAHEESWLKLMARPRDFHPVEGTGRRCLTGLKNLGNTCYMNSILQCLANFDLPARYFLNRHRMAKDLNVTSKTEGNVAIEYAEVLRNLKCGQYKSIVPNDFKHIIGKYKQSFRNFNQQDAHELLNNLMQWLHDDLNEVQGVDKLKLPEQKNEGVPEIIAAQRAWELERKVDRSFIRDTFYGQWRSVLTCQSCTWESVKYEPFFELCLQLPPGNGRCTLRQCIEGFLEPEEVDYKCPRCERNRLMTKKFEIVKLPPIIIIQLVRFYNDGLSRKRQNVVDFEINDLDLGVYARACGDGQLNQHRLYKLYGVCNHTGSMEGGHYTAYCYSEPRGGWYKYDDHEVYEIEAREVRTPKAYILFYASKSYVLI